MNKFLPLSLSALTFFGIVCNGDSNCNVLCESSDITVVKGIWDYDGELCTLENTDNGSGNNIWFGLGLDEPFDSYDFDSFIFTTRIVLNQNSGDAGVMFRASSVSTTNDNGDQYYIGLYPSSDSVVFGKMGGSWNPIQSASYTLDIDTEYELTIYGDETVYTVYIDDEYIMEVNDDTYLTGSVGLRTYNSPATYTYVYIVKDKKNQNILCKNNYNDFTFVKGVWSFDRSECTIENVDTAAGNIVWFGTGLDTADDDYIYDDFIYTVNIIFNENSGDSGVIFRATSVSTSNNGGDHYYIGLYPASDTIKFGKMGGSWNVLSQESYTIDTDIEYELKIEATGSEYTVYIDNTEVMTVVDSTYTTGAIGLRSWNLPSTYTGVKLEDTSTTLVRNKHKNNNKQLRAGVDKFIKSNNGNDVNINDYIMYGSFGAAFLVIIGLFNKCINNDNRYSKIVDSYGTV